MACFRSPHVTPRVLKLGGHRVHSTGQPREGHIYIRKVSPTNGCVRPDNKQVKVKANYCNAWKLHP